jgi:cytochrome P450
VSIDYRPNDPAVLADPFPLYARLRDEDPAHWSPRLKAWVLTRYEDVKRVCLDTGSMSSDRLRPFFATLPPPEAMKVAELVRYLTLWMVFRDPPEHTRLRRLAAKVFNVRSIHALRPNIEQLTHWLLDQIPEKREFDFIGDFAMPLPALVIIDMLGAPARGDSLGSSSVRRDGALHRQRTRLCRRSTSAPAPPRARWRACSASW